MLEVTHPTISGPLCGSVWAWQSTTGHYYRGTPNPQRKSASICQNKPENTHPHCARRYSDKHLSRRIVRPWLVTAPTDANINNGTRYSMIIMTADTQLLLSHLANRCTVSSKGIRLTKPNPEA